MVNTDSFRFDSANSFLENAKTNSENVMSCPQSECPKPAEGCSNAKTVDDLACQIPTQESMDLKQSETEQRQPVTMADGDCGKGHLAEIARLKGYLIELDQEITFEAERTNRCIRELETQLEKRQPSTIGNEERDSLLNRIRELETGNDNLQEALLMLQARMCWFRLKFANRY